MRTRVVFVLLTFFFSQLFSNILAQERAEWMNTEKMDTIFHTIMDQVERDGHTWQLAKDDRLLLVITDSTNNRMRLFTVIENASNVSQNEMRLLLEANFHSALDAKYSIYENYVISVFTHPLRELTEHQLVDACGQVLNLAINFGTTYSSTGLIFGAPDTEEAAPAVPKEKKGKRS